MSMYSPYLSPFIAGFVKTIEWKSPIIQLHIITMKPLTYGEVLAGLHPIFMLSGRRKDHVRRKFKKEPISREERYICKQM